MNKAIVYTLGDKTIYYCSSHSNKYDVIEISIVTFSMCRSKGFLAEHPHNYRAYKLLGTV